MDQKEIDNKLTKLLYNIRGRCADMMNPYYGGRGIKNKLTLDDLRELWTRDNAESLSWPSIDRIDSWGNYSKENCRFIELSENGRKAAALRLPIEVETGQRAIFRAQLHVGRWLEFEVEVKQARRAYGRIDALITPVGGNGEIWVNAKDLTFLDLGK